MLSLKKKKKRNLMVPRLVLGGILWWNALFNENRNIYKGLQGYLGWRIWVDLAPAVVGAPTPISPFIKKCPNSRQNSSCQNPDWIQNSDSAGLTMPLAFPLTLLPAPLKEKLPRARFGSTYTKTGNDTEKISMAPAQGWHANSWSIPY